MLSVVMLTVVMLSVVMLTFVMLSVVPPVNTTARTSVTKKKISTDDVRTSPSS